MQDEHSGNDGGIAAFAPRRTRADRQPARSVAEVASVSDILPMTERIRDDAARFYTMVQNLQESEKRAVERYNTEHARAEQLEARLAEMQIKMEAVEARSRLEMEARVRLGSIMENIGGLVADGLSLNTNASTA